MNARASLANFAWLASCLPAHQRFIRALRDPAAAQQRWLRNHLARHGGSAYGRTHGGNAILSYADFARRVPVVGYDELEPWIDRIRRGEQNVLTCGPVTRLVPTSGSSGPRKLIPFTPDLQREFNAAIGPWIVGLAAAHPSIALGPAYWSVTPMGEDAASAAIESAVPIGFDDDAKYLGGVRARLVASAMAVPPSVCRISDTASFRRTVLRHLLLCRDLRLVSIWHPSFLALLLDTLACEWETFLDDVSRANARHARELREADPALPHSIWPHLKVVSCWADAHAAGPAATLQDRLPGVAVQPKGLLATEGCVSLPFAGQHPVAVTSHFFEFIAPDDTIALLQDLRPGYEYEVVITTGGGLWRYRLGDRVEVTGFVGRTPSLRFLGRAGNVSDRCGEKLSEAFVMRVLAELCPGAPFSMLAPERAEAGWRYALYLAAGARMPEPAALDKALQANPHYALCRRLGQLQEPRVVAVGADAYARYTVAETARGRRLGDIKPAALSQRSDWSEHFGTA